MEGDIPVCTFPTFQTSTKTAADGKSTTVIDTADQDVSLAFESPGALQDAMLAALDAVSRAVEKKKKKKEIMSGRLRLVTNAETSADSLASQETNPSRVPEVSPGSAGSTKRTVATGKAVGQRGPKRLQLEGSILVSRPDPPTESPAEMVPT
jgi:hypothetical protein